MTHRVTMLSWPILLGVLGAFFGMGPVASSGTAPESAHGEGEARVLESPVHPAPHGARFCPCPGTGAGLQSSAVAEETSGAPEGAEPLRPGEFRDGARCRRNWMGGTCFLQEDWVCSLIVFKVNDEWRMDCY